MQIHRQGWASAFSGVFVLRRRILFEHWYTYNLSKMCLQNASKLFLMYEIMQRRLLSKLYKNQRSISIQFYDCGSKEECAQIKERKIDLDVIISWIPYITYIHKYLIHQRFKPRIGLGENWRGTYTQLFIVKYSRKSDRNRKYLI